MQRETAAIIKKWYRFGKLSDREDSPYAGERPPDGLKTTDGVLEVVKRIANDGHGQIFEMLDGILFEDYYRLETRNYSTSHGMNPYNELIPPERGHYFTVVPSVAVVLTNRDGVQRSLPEYWEMGDGEPIARFLLKGNLDGDAELADTTQLQWAADETMRTANATETLIGDTWFETESGQFHTVVVYPLIVPANEEWVKNVLAGVGG